MTRAASSAPRTRRAAGPLRLLWLAALLFAFLYTHAAGADSASAHVSGGAVTVTYFESASESADGGGPPHHGERAPGGLEDGGGHAHPAEACASGHPQQGVDVPGLPLVAFGEPAPACAAMTPAPWARTAPSALPPLRSSLGSVVQRV
ncbi:hypothetical protein [Streptomyces sp. NBC_00091]|uniref:hypothetical protein n=1 Tax=Streptomyces sp. NBC_00091 TaxID=2975648 RepID=UPI00225B44C3|nr:hypothetical protein [Streptomyces sp. NBC_00091]MCX5381537.1 hypothetical protein [Streptomyces sp. NBC_00091]